MKPFHKAKKEDPDITDLAWQLGDINLLDAEYTALYVDIISHDPAFQDTFETPKSRSAQLVQRQGNCFQRSPPFQWPFQSSGPGPSRGNLHCFRCGQEGYHIWDCKEISALIQSGTIVWDSYTERLCWPDGSHIYRVGDESWIQVIKSTKQANLVRLGGHCQDPGTVYNYLGVTREDNNTSTEVQEELHQQNVQLTVQALCCCGNHKAASTTDIPPYPHFNPQ